MYAQADGLPTRQRRWAVRVFPLRHRQPHGSVVSGSQGTSHQESRQFQHLAPARTRPCTARPGGLRPTTEAPERTTPRTNHVRPGRNCNLLRVSSDQPCAFSYAWRTSAEIRPRLDTSMPFSTAQARISLVEPPLLSLLAARPAERVRFRPPTFRACANQGANAPRKSAAFADERSISYSAPSSANETVSSAWLPS